MQLTSGPGGVRLVPGVSRVDRWLTHALFLAVGILAWPPHTACHDLSLYRYRAARQGRKASPGNWTLAKQKPKQPRGHLCHDPAADRPLLMELNPNMVTVYSEAFTSLKSIWKEYMLPLVSLIHFRPAVRSVGGSPLGWGEWGGKPYC